MARRFVGNYELLEEIGGGPRYRVSSPRRGHRSSGGGRQASRGRSGRSRADAQRFIKEVRAQARIDHDNIVPYRGSGDDRGQLYYVMRHMCAGQNLAQFIEERRSRWTRSTRPDS